MVVIGQRLELDSASWTGSSENVLALGPRAAFRALCLPWSRSGRTGL